MISQDDYQEVLQMRREFAALRADLMRTARDYYARKYSPNQPRVPAGRREGGQWTNIGGGASRTNPGANTSVGSGSARRVQLADASNVLHQQVMSDATPDPVIPGAQYAQTRIEFGPNALTGISTIDNTTKTLANTLATVVDILPNGSGPLYGIAVHTAFATAVRAQNLPGIASSDVETTFGLVKTFRYGSKGSIRTDVVLRNDIGDIIAIYDVKTGGAKITKERAEELRKKTRTGSNVPIVELNLNRGVILKRAMSVVVSRAVPLPFLGVSHVHGN